MASPTDYSSGNNKKDAALRVLWNNLQGALGDQGSKMFGEVARSAVKAVAPGDDAQKQEVADKAGAMVGAGVKMGTAFSANMRDFTVVAKKSRQRVNRLLDLSEPFLIEEFGKSSRGKLLRSDNEVIAHARREVMGYTRNELYGAASQLTDKIPTALSMMAERHNALAEKAAGAEEGPTLDEIDIDVADASGKEDGLPTDIEAESKRLLADARQQWDARLDAVAQADMFSDENVKMLGLAINTGAPFLNEYFEEQNVELYGSHSAFEMIAKLVDMARTGNGNVSSVQIGRNSYPLADYIMEIFKQHQEDMGQTPINDRFQNADELRDACDAIANEINHNLLDPVALIGLVGNRDILDEHLRVASPVQVQEALRQSWRVLERGEEVDVKEFISETAFATPEDFRAILEEMPQEDKAFFVSLWPNAVLKEAGGLGDEEIDDLKDRAGDDFVAKMGEAVTALAELNPDELQRHGLTRSEGQLVRKLAQTLELRGEERFADQLQGQTRKDVTRAVSNARGYWQDRINGEARQPFEKEEEREDVLGDSGQEERRASFLDRLQGRDSSEIER